MLHTRPYSLPSRLRPKFSISRDHASTGSTRSLTPKMRPIVRNFSSSRSVTTGPVA
ncbi:hypothetical protein HD593_008026 [Nonomuraea rubra]|uniref:Uncharacterized protein n=1 Tax=Nonomuraea rubra TaxID=46180 RepID=A0A7X0U2Z0_9ACTN|nr:hypothetical protein [Nonomuraea rubra]